MSADTDYILDETSIEQGGVLRCCLGTVAQEYKGKRVKLGDKSACQHCKETFTLVMVKPPMTTCFRNPTFPIWKPDWQLQPKA